jgi:hypothetical protein
MYKKHDTWDTEKLDVHSSGYAGSGQKPGDSMDSYHKNEGYSTKDNLYGSSDKSEDKMKDSYNSNQQEDDNKDKDKEEQEKNIVDTVEEEEKKQHEEEQDESQIVTKNIQQEDFSNPNQDKKEKKPRKQHKSIEEAIDKAVKEEKETVFMD